MPEVMSETKRISSFKVNGKRVIVFDGLDSLHFVSTADHGCVKSPLLLGMDNGLRRYLNNYFGGINNIHAIAAQHGKEIIVLGAHNSPKEESAVYEGDALFHVHPKNKTSNKILSFTTGDCPYILIEGQNHGLKIVGGVHSGWRGTALNIVGQSLAQVYMLGFASYQLKIALWSGICPNCYEVGKDVKKELRYYKESFKMSKRGAWKLNLAQIIRKQLNQYGIKDDQIVESGICPHCHRDNKGSRWLYSQRMKEPERNGLFIL